MKSIKYILISFGILLLLFVGFGYLQDRNVTVSRSLIINAPISVVFEQFYDLEKRLDWSPWERIDTSIQVQLGEITKGKGASYSWVSSNSGSGKLIYAKVIPNQLIESLLYFGESDNNPAQGFVFFKQVEDGIKVTWEVRMDMKFNPFMRLMGRYMDDIVGNTFLMGLNSVKDICEAKASNISDVNITVSNVISKPCVSLLDSCSLNQFSERLSIDNGLLFSEINSQKLELNGFPRVVYHVWEPPTKVVFEVQLPINEYANIKTDRIKMSKTYAGKVLKAIHIGPYEEASPIWEALDKYVSSHQLNLNGSPWEEYENSPQTVSHTSKLITHIYFPIK